MVRLLLLLVTICPTVAASTRAEEAGDRSGRCPASAAATKGDAAGAARARYEEFNAHLSRAQAYIVRGEYGKSIPEWDEVIRLTACSRLMRPLSRTHSPSRLVG